MIPVGTRVTREVYLDDGTWLRLGDSCLPGPLKHGCVVGHFLGAHEVGWDDPKYRGQHRYFTHGLGLEEDLDEG